MDNGISPADLAAVVKDNDSCGNGAWWIIVLFVVLFGGNGFWGNNGYDAATTADIQRAVDLNSVQRGQADIMADIQRTTYEQIAATKDAAYNNLSEIRDTQAAANAGFSDVKNNLTCGFARMQENSCETQRAIDNVKYEAAMNTAAINSNIDAKFNRIEKGQLEQQIAAQAAQIQQLQLNAALCGVVRYPNQSVYAYPPAGPFMGGTSF